jgi:hypothetical protein
MVGSSSQVVAMETKQFWAYLDVYELESKEALQLV